MYVSIVSVCFVSLLKMKDVNSVMLTVKDSIASYPDCRGPQVVGEVP